MQPSNGQKITDAQVQNARERRAGPNPPSYDELAQELGINRKVIARICRGKARKSAPGPIEAAPVHPNVQQRYDITRKVRCEGCRSMVHPLGEETRLFHDIACLFCEQQEVQRLKNWLRMAPIDLPEPAAVC